MKAFWGIVTAVLLFSVLVAPGAALALIGAACGPSTPCGSGEVCSTSNICVAAGSSGNLNVPANGLPTEGIPTTGQDLIERIGVIGNWVFAIFLALSIIYIVLAAFQFVTGGGDPAQVSAARQKLIYAAIGIGIALLSAGFDDILKSILVAQ